MFAHLSTRHQGRSQTHGPEISCEPYLTAHCSKHSGNWVEVSPELWISKITVGQNDKAVSSLGLIRIIAESDAMSTGNCKNFYNFTNLAIGAFVGCISSGNMWARAVVGETVKKPPFSGPTGRGNGTRAGLAERTRHGANTGRTWATGLFGRDDPAETLPVNERASQNKKRLCKP